MGLYFLDYGAGNVRSLANSLKKLGYDFQWVTCPDDFHKATVCPHPHGETDRQVHTSHTLYRA